MKSTPAKRLLGAALSCALFVATGCGALPITLTAVLPVVITGASSGISYTFTNIAYKTYNYPIDDVELALHAALERMDMEEIERTSSDDTLRVRVRTKKLKIYIDLERITPKATRIKVNAKRLLIFKDKATATEIIIQTDKVLRETHEEQPEEPAPAPNDKESPQPSPSEEKSTAA